MNQKTWTNGNRKLVWTVSLNNNSLYCIYVHGVLVHEDISFEEFYPLYKRTVAKLNTKTHKPKQQFATV